MNFFFTKLPYKYFVAKLSLWTFPYQFSLSKFSIQILKQISLTNFLYQIFFYQSFFTNIFFIKIFISNFLYQNFLYQHFLTKFSYKNSLSNFLYQNFLIILLIKIFLSNFLHKNILIIFSLSNKPELIFRMKLFLSNSPY